MRYEKSRSPLKVSVLTIFFITSGGSALAQKPAPTNPADDVGEHSFGADRRNRR